MTIDINHCPIHHCWSVSVSDNDGGERITPNKCCGGWGTVKSFPLTAKDWMRAARLCEKAAKGKEK